MGLVTQSNMHVETFPGIWRCRYWFPSNIHPGEEVSEYYVRIDPSDGGFTLHSLPNTLDAYLQAHFTVEANLATGAWLEDTSPNGEFEGMTYSGVFQCIISDDMRHLAGNWVGIGKEQQSPRIYDGKWQIEYVGMKLDELPKL